MRIFLVFIFLLASCFSLLAAPSPERQAVKQMKNDIVEIRQNIKKSSNLDKSEATVLRHLGDTLLAADRTMLRGILVDVLRRAYEVGNEKAYLKQKVDTTCLMHTTRRLFLAAESLDSASTGDRRRNATYLMPRRVNLIRGGVYFMRHQQWQDAYDCLDTYLDCVRQPLFAGDSLTLATDTMLPRAAYLALHSAANLKRADLALRYADLALRHTTRRDMALVLLAELTRQAGDTVAYERYITTGTREYPHSTYFFPHLIDLYNATARQQQALALADSALRRDANSTMFMLARHSTLMTLQRYDEALADGLILTADTTMTNALPYYNVGFIFHRRAAQALAERQKPYRTRIANAQKQYRYALPYIERYRVLRPDDRQHWQPILYDIYLNLNMGAEFRELQEK